MRALWVSRHIPQESTLADLRRVGVTEVLVPTGDPTAPTWVPWNGQIISGWTLPQEPNAAAEAIAATMRETKTNEVVGVLPVTHLAALTARGIRPLRAVMERFPTGRVLPNGETEYEFRYTRLERVLKVEVVVEPV